MIPDRDIYRSAQALVKQHGQDAPIEAAVRSEEPMPTTASKTEAASALQMVSEPKVLPKAAMILETEVVAVRRTARRFEMVSMAVTVFDSDVMVIPRPGRELPLSIRKTPIEPNAAFLPLSGFND